MSPVCTCDCRDDRSILLFHPDRSAVRLLYFTEANTILRDETIGSLWQSITSKQVTMYPSASLRTLGKHWMRSFVLSYNNPPSPVSLLNTVPHKMKSSLLEEWSTRLSTIGDLSDQCSSNCVPEALRPFWTFYHLLITHQGKSRARQLLCTEAVDAHRMVRLGVQSLTSDDSPLITTAFKVLSVTVACHATDLQVRASSIFAKV